MLTQKKDETRKDYLIRVAIHYIEIHHASGEIFYDEAQCDGYCLIEDLRTVRAER